jgi:hypothetical protein
MDYQIVYEDNVDVDGVLRARQITVQSSNEIGDGSIAAQSMITNEITANTIVSSGAISGQQFATTGNTAASGEVKATTITATDTISGTNVVATTLKADIIDVNTGTTTQINAPKLPTTLSTNIMSGKYIPVADTNGVVALLQAPSLSEQYLGSDGTGAMLWKAVSVTGTLNNWAILNEQYINGNGSTYYDGTIIRSASSISQSSASYIRVFTAITESTTGSVITGKTSVSFTNASPNSVCYTDFTLASGKYLFIGSFPSGTAPGANNNAYIKHYINIESANSSFTSVQGTQEMATATTRTLINNMVTLSISTKLLVKHYTTFTTSGNITAHLGVASGSGTPFYGTLLIVKL